MRLGLEGIGRGSRALVFPGRPLALHAMVSSAGFELQRSAAYDWHGLRRGAAEFALVQITISGEGRLRLGREEWPVRPGSAMILHFPQDNRYWCPEGGSWEFCWICLHGREVMRAWRAAQARRGPLIDLAAGSTLLAESCAVCRAVVAGEVSSQFVASRLAYGLAMRLLEEVCADATAPQPWPGLAQAKELGLRRALDGIGVDELAAAAACSRWHFARRFAAAEGMSPGRWLQGLRIAAAARLLRESRLPMAEVARRCGFSEVSYFCRAFRRSIGVSPGAFRSSGMY